MLQYFNTSMLAGRLLFIDIFAAGSYNAVFRLGGGLNSISLLC